MPDPWSSSTVIGSVRAVDHHLQPFSSPDGPRCEGREQQTAGKSYREASPC